jgi:hypothetical protein
MRNPRLKATIVSSVLTVLATAWGKLQFIFDAFQLPANSGSVWRALMDSPKLVPWVLVALSLGVLGWSLRRPKQRVVEAPAETEHDRLVRQERARLEAAEQHRRERAARRLAGSMAEQMPDVREEIELDRKAEAAARRAKLVRDAETAQPQSFAVAFNEATIPAYRLPTLPSASPIRAGGQKISMEAAILGSASSWKSVAR